MSVDVLLFSTDWCGPCKAMERAGVYSAVESAGYSVTKVDGDKERGLLSQYGIQAFPTFIIRKEGIPVGRLIGARTADSLIAELRLVENG